VGIQYENQIDLEREPIGCQRYKVFLRVDLPMLSLQRTHLCVRAICLVPLNEGRKED
jgi:hypothetical protein